VRPRTLPGEVWRGVLNIGTGAAMLYAVRERGSTITVRRWDGTDWVIERNVLVVMLAALRHEQDQAMRAEARLAEELATNKQLNKDLHAALDAVVEEMRERRNAEGAIECYKARLTALGADL